MNKKHLLNAMLMMGLAQTSNIYAEGIFHTIIGPDGRPMVVQRPDLPIKKKVEVKKESPVLTGEVSVKPEAPSYLDPEREAHVQDVVRGLAGKRPAQIVQGVAQEQHQQQMKSTKKDAQQAVANEEKRVDHASSTPIPQHDVIEKQVEKKLDAPKITVVNTPATEDLTVAKPNQTTEKVSKQTIEASSKVAVEKLPQASVEQQKKLVKVPPMPEIVQDQKHKQLSTIDGDTYVNNEYLEEKEFNLEGKKRFYAMPEGVIDPKTGATRMQMVEREKGVGQSVIDNLFKKNRATEDKPIVLSTSYYRVSKADTVEGLGQQCFSQKQLLKAKSLKAHQDTNLWPRAPIKAQFDFEVVQLDAGIKNIEIHSYASKKNNPVFYWPFAVFLDAKGCVMEGAGGYKNNDADANHLYREKIEGVLQIPSDTKYLLLTPLATAIDVDERVLSNQGQLKLIAIR
jgi:hypothetical protein